MLAFPRSLQRALFHSVFARIERSPNKVASRALADHRAAYFNLTRENRGFSFMARTPGGASILVLKWPLPVTEFVPWFTHPSKLVSCLRLRLASSLAKPSLRPPFGCRTLRL